MVWVSSPSAAAFGRFFYQATRVRVTQAEASPMNGVFLSC
jgi:hypothetical protein